ncbi:hypothetical protein DEU56DRAFT_920178 [Suillus clintonianus]|uniref:uncharacterized protein n=1 Tax=Suillus clintonianus TaxID=1904413 RepID=UPI001B876092|nr:uncharacterized protein DEU56DRAFT_920178 [Suillus clintonianus]KAG2110411.1 hypothetical protein DEU56DRAFT_920178 [Suillus clintonianus]
MLLVRRSTLLTRTVVLATTLYFPKLAFVQATRLLSLSGSSIGSDRHIIWELVSSIPRLASSLPPLNIEQRTSILISIILSASMSHEGSTSEPHIQDQGSMSHVEDWQDDHSQRSQAAAASLQARQRRKIAQLEAKLGTLESGRAVKEKQTNYYVAQGRAIKRIVTLFDTIEDLVTENDRRCDVEEDAESSLDEDRLQVGYVTLTATLPWLPTKAAELDNEDYCRMLKLLRQGADGARGDDTSKLKALVAEWLNREFKPDPLIDADDKHSHGFTNDTCGKLLCPAELDWNNPVIRAGIRDRIDGHIVTDLSFPAFLYDKYTANPNDLEEGLFKGKVLLQAYKAVFTSPSSAKDVEGDGDGIDVIQNNRRAKNSVFGVKVKKHVAQIIRMKKVTPRSIAYIACQVRFALSSVTSWRSVDGDFDYEQFWRSIVDFFERAPGRAARRRVDVLLEWWTRKVFGRNHRNDLTSTAKANMSINALARQRAQRDDAAFDSS